jgi:transcriptional regulator
MTTITFKINERTKAGKAFMTMKDTFFANANGIEIVEKTNKIIAIDNEKAIEELSKSVNKSLHKRLLKEYESI